MKECVRSLADADRAAASPGNLLFIAAEEEL